MQFVTDNLQVILTAAAVLAGVIIALMLLGAFGRRTRGRRGQRLGISEYHELDQNRRLVLIRRDDTEHLLLIGGTQDLVVESGIGIPHHEAQAKLPATAEIREIRAPRPPVFGERRPLPQAEREPPVFATARVEPVKE